jgi:hypothetical protein
MTQSSEEFVVTLWDKQVNEPYMTLEYASGEEAKQVARNIKKHYIEDWGASGAQFYEVRLQRRVSNG